MKTTMREAMTSTAALAALAAAALLAAPEPASAQDDGTTYAAKELTFSVELSGEVTEELIEDRRPMDAGTVGRLLAETGTVRYRAERPVEGRAAAFIVGEHGIVGERGEVVRDRLVTDPDRLEPGDHGLGEVLPLAKVAERLERYFPDTLFVLAEVLFPGADWNEERFPDSIFSPEYFPDSTFESAGMERGQVGVLVAVGPADGETQRVTGFGSFLAIFDRDEDR